MDEKNKLIQWIKEHKKQLLIAGICVTTLIVLILRNKNKELLKAMWEKLKVKIEPASENIVHIVVEKTTVTPVPAPTKLVIDEPSIPFEVRRHIRTLPEGLKASPGKIVSAFEYNIILTERQTWVDSYTKGGNVA